MKNYGKQVPKTPCSYCLKRTTHNYSSDGWVQEWVCTECNRLTGSRTPELPDPILYPLIQKIKLAIDIIR